MNSIQIAKGMTYFKVETVGRRMATQPAKIKRLLALTDSYFDTKEDALYCVFQEVNEKGAAVSKSSREDLRWWNMNDTVKSARAHLFDSPELAAAFAVAIDLQAAQNAARVRSEAIANNLILLEEVIPGFVFHCAHVIPRTHRTFVESLEVVALPVVNESVGSYFVLVRDLENGIEVTRSLFDMNIGELNSHNAHRSFRRLSEAHAYLENFSEFGAQGMPTFSPVWSSMANFHFERTLSIGHDLKKAFLSEQVRLPKRPHGKRSFKQNPPRNTGPKTKRW
jgi:hypothetical protein